MFLNMENYYIYKILKEYDKHKEHKNWLVIGKALKNKISQAEFRRIHHICEQDQWITSKKGTNEFLMSDPAGKAKLKSLKWYFFYLHWSFWIIAILMLISICLQICFKFI